MENVLVFLGSFGLAAFLVVYSVLVVNKVFNELDK